MEDIQDMQEHESQQERNNRQKMVVSSVSGEILLLARVDTHEVVEGIEAMVAEDEAINQLALEGITINSALCTTLARLLQETDRTWHSLKLVDCRHELIDDTPKQNLEKALSKVKQLFLQTSTNNQETGLYFLPVEAATSVSSVRLCVSNLDEDLASKLVTAVKTTENLVELSLSGSRRCGLQTDMLTEAFKGNSSLEKLGLGDCMLNDRSMCRLVSALQGHPKLRQLDLSNNSWSDRTLESLNCLLAKGECPLEVLEISLQRRTLNISLLAPALARHDARLKQLYVSNCGLKDEETFPFVDALTKNQSLETLDVSKNRQLSDNFLIYLAERLPKMHLKVLNIRKLQPPNGSPAAMRALSEGVRQNTTLQLLRLLFWKQLRPARWIQIYINLNRGGRKALEEKIPLALWPLVFERAQNRIYYCPLLKQLNAKEDVMFHLLQNEPSLWC